MADRNRLRLTVAFYNLHDFNQGKMLLTSLYDTRYSFCTRTLVSFILLWQITYDQCWKGMFCSICNGWYYLQRLLDWSTFWWYCCVYQRHAEGHPICKKTDRWDWDVGVVICVGERCRFAYGPADATATHYLLLQQIQIGFTFLVLAHLSSPGLNPEEPKTIVCVCAGKVKLISLSTYYLVVNRCVLTVYFNSWSWGWIHKMFSKHNECPHHRKLFCCSMKIMPSLPSVSLNSLLGTSIHPLHPFNGPLSGTTRVSQYQKHKTRKVKPIWIYWSKK